MTTHDMIGAFDDGRDRDPSAEQFAQLFDEVIACIQQARVEGTPFLDDLPQGDTPATRYEMPIDDEQVQQLFLVPDEISSKHPRHFTVQYTTPHRIIDSDEPYSTIDFSYEYSDEKLVSYQLRRIETEHGVTEWTGAYIQEDDIDVEDVIREITRADLRMLATVVASISHG